MYAPSVPSTYASSIPSPSYIRIESSSQPESSSSSAIQDICQLTPEDFSKYEIFENVLGEGAYGKVYEGRNKQTSEYIAIKVQNKSKIFPSEIVNIRHECNVLSTLDHPNIIKIYGGYDDGHNIYWILSYMCGGDLMTFMTERARSGLNISGARNIFRQLVDAIDYCHSRNVIHRDIKLENILLRDVCVSATDCHIVLGDFGLATYQTVDGPDIRTFPGTVTYVAPEIALGIPYRGRATDIWAMGIVLYVITQVRYPFFADTDQGIMEMIISYPPSPMVAPTAITNLVKRMLAKDPQTRITMEEIKAQMF
jgi:serine/threonine protein kinase